jgi:hypothetical protein
MKVNHLCTKGGDLAIVIKPFMTNLRICDREVFCLGRPLQHGVMHVGKART